MVCVWLHFSRYQEQARKDIAVVTQRVHRILLDVGKVRCLWINPHLYFFSFPTFIKCSWRILFVTSRFLFSNETWIVWEGFSFTWRARSVCVLVDFWSVSLGTSENNCTFVCFFCCCCCCCLLIYLTPWLFLSQQIAFQIRQLGFSVSRSNL